MNQKINVRHIIWYWFPVLLIAGGIFYSSSTPYGEQDIRPQLSQIKFLSNMINQLDFIHFNYAGKEISVEKLGAAGFLELIIRKLAHFSVFLILSFFTTRLVRLYTKNFVLIGLILTILYAVSDEYHQSFTADRTPLVQDVVIDSLGAIVGSIIYLVCTKMFNKKRH